jgi:hypothetical protein
LLADVEKVPFVSVSPPHVSALPRVNVPPEPSITIEELSVTPFVVMVCEVVELNVMTAVVLQTVPVFIVNDPLTARVLGVPAALLNVTVP